jgi:hypothetical protein
MKRPKTMQLKRTFGMLSLVFQTAYANGKYFKYESNRHNE